MNRLLPIGIQDFAKIREGAYYYVDKTAQIYRLLSGSGQSFFLSRPRRFGKSMICSTLSAIFEGKRELFAGLAIDKSDWAWKKHPVIKIDLNPSDYSAEGVDGLYANLNRNMEESADKYGVTISGDMINDRFARLIHSLYKQCNERVVVIIDEYDKPLLSTIDEPSVHVKLRSALKGFYGVLKSSDQYLRFVFLTGVTKFSHVSIFSDLNHLSDLTLDPRYADICGITQEEVENNFQSEIADILEKTGKSRETYLDELRRFYNGYRFSEKDLKVYNPFGLLKHFENNGKFNPFWYETGTPTFLVKLIINRKINIVELSNMNVGHDDFRKYDIENLQAAPLLYQSGYLTIADYDEELDRFSLDYPNAEVRMSFAKSLLDLYVPVDEHDSRALCEQLPKALLAGDVDAAMNALKAFLAAVPYDIIQNRENYFQTAIHLVFTMLGLNCRPETRIAAGRIDALVETKNNVYCFEFKMKGSADTALAQIDAKEYALPWTGSGKNLFKVGVSFNAKKRNIGAWKYVKIEN